MAKKGGFLYYLGIGLVTIAAVGGCAVLIRALAGKDKDDKKDPVEHVHVWDEGEELTSATCSVPGEMEYTCEECGEVKTESIPARHTDANGDGVCDVCGETDGQTVKVWELCTDESALNVGDQIIIAAESEELAMGKIQAVSNRNTASIAKYGITATFGDDVQVITLENGVLENTFAFNVGMEAYLYAPSSSSNQLKTHSFIDENSSWKISIGSIGANFAATIVAQGESTRNNLMYNGSSNLFSCYETTTQRPVVIYQLVEHVHVWDEGVELTSATCSDPGKMAYTCEECGETKTEPIAAKHKLVILEGVEPTCTTEGKTEGVVCESCGKVYVEQEAIGTVEHSYENGQCTNCGAYELAYFQTDGNYTEVDLTDEEKVAGNYYRLYKKNPSDGSPDFYFVIKTDVDSKVSYTFMLDTSDPSALFLSCGYVQKDAKDFGFEYVVYDGYVDLYIPEGIICDFDFYSQTLGEDCIIEITPETTGQISTGTIKRLVPIENTESE